MPSNIAARSLLTAAILACGLQTPPAAANQAAPAPIATPPVNAVVTNFYYDDLAAARAWYVDRLGLKTVYDDKWVVIVEIGRGMQIALVDGNQGAMRAVAEKGTMLSVETDALEAWYDKMKVIPGIRWAERAKGVIEEIPGTHIGRHKDIEAFRVLDPGGYMIEFYRWRPEYRPAS